MRLEDLNWMEAFSRTIVSGLPDEIKTPPVISSAAHTEPARSAGPIVRLLAIDFIRLDSYDEIVLRKSSLYGFEPAHR